MNQSQEAEIAARRIVVLAGGPSAERMISLQSGRAVVCALQSRDRRVVEVDPAVTDLEMFDWSPVDLVFNALHGSFGEDSGVQQILEARGVPFTGSGSLASRLTFSKSASKVRMLQCGVPTPKFAVVHRGRGSDPLPQIAARIGYPLVIKPDQQGSSLGVSLVTEDSELDAAFQRAVEFGDCIVLESAVIGTEWTLAAIDNDPLPLIQIRTSHTLFDFDAKYVDDATEHCFEFDAPSSVTNGIVAAGLEAVRILGTTGLVRVDLMLDHSGRPWVLEVNTVPGLTDHSLAPKAAARAGMTMSDLCDRLLAGALAAHRGEASRRRAG